MKKLFILILFIPCLCFAGAGIVGLSSVGNNNISGDETPQPADCATGTYLFSYDGDHSSGADYACYNSGASSEQASANTVDSVSTDYVEFDDANEHLIFTESGIVSGTETVYCSLYVIDRDTDSTIGSFVILEGLVNSSTGFILYRDSSYIRLDYRDGSTSNCASSVSISFDTWYRIGITWDQPNDKYSISVVTLGNSPSWHEETGEGLSAWGTTPSTICIGEDWNGSTIQERVRVADVYAVSGYQAGDL